MNKKPQNRKSPRLPEYDYSNPAYYFVTIFTQNHENHFGSIQDSRMHFNKLGELAEKHLSSISNHYNNVELDYQCIMPNHIHAIIIINNVEDAFTASRENKVKKFNMPRDAEIASPTYDRTKMTLSKVVQQFKRGVTMESISLFGKKKEIWQRSFYDRIIRNEKELYNIRKYIEQNPLKWEYERNCPENINV